MKKSIYVLSFLLLIAFIVLFIANEINKSTIKQYKKIVKDQFVIISEQDSLLQTK